MAGIHYYVAAVAANYLPLLSSECFCTHSSLFIEFAGVNSAGSCSGSGSVLRLC